MTTNIFTYILIQKSPLTLNSTHFTKPKHKPPLNFNKQFPSHAIPKTRIYPHILKLNSTKTTFTILEEYPSNPAQRPHPLRFHISEEISESRFSKNIQHILSFQKPIFLNAFLYWKSNFTTQSRYSNSQMFHTSYLQRNFLSEFQNPLTNNHLLLFFQILKISLNMTQLRLNLRSFHIPKMSILQNLFQPSFIRQCRFDPFSILPSLISPFLVVTVRSTTKKWQETLQWNEPTTTPSISQRQYFYSTPHNWHKKSITFLLNRNSCQHSNHHHSQLFSNKSSLLFWKHRKHKSTLTSTKHLSTANMKHSTHLLHHKISSRFPFRRVQYSTCSHISFHVSTDIFWQILLHSPRTFPFTLIFQTNTTANITTMKPIKH